MSKTAVYHLRGTLKQCITYIIQHHPTWPDELISIVSNDHSQYYGVVDDAWLSREHTHPEDQKMRLMLRINQRELETIYNAFASLQTELFPKTTQKGDSTN